MGAMKNMLEEASEVVSTHPYIKGDRAAWLEQNVDRFANRMACSVDVARYFVETATNHADRSARENRDV